MPKYNVGCGVVGGCYVGEFEANSPQEAIEKGCKHFGICLCHQCSKEVSDLEPDHWWAEDMDTGHHTTEDNEHELFYSLQEDVANLKDCLRILVNAYETNDEQAFDEGFVRAEDLLEKLEPPNNDKKHI